MSTIVRNNNFDACSSVPAFREAGAIFKEEGQQMALLALSHTKTEHHLYETMLEETQKAKTKIGAFSIRQLMIQTGLHSYSSIRRARVGLIKKLSIEPQKVAGCEQKSPRVIFVIYEPSEIFARRRQAGLSPYPKEIFKDESDPPAVFGEIFKTLIEKNSLSRREAQVALKCAEGLTNAEIGEKLFIHEETVKFHLRNIFIKFGVKRRTELMARLFRQKVPAMTAAAAVVVSGRRGGGND